MIFWDLRYVEQQLLIRIALNILKDINISIRLQWIKKKNIIIIIDIIGVVDAVFCLFAQSKNKSAQSPTLHRQQPRGSAAGKGEWTGIETLCSGYLVPLVSLVPRLEHQPPVSVSALVQTLQLLHVDALVQPVFQAPLRGLVFPRATAAVSVSVTVSVSWHRGGPRRP